MQLTTNLVYTVASAIAHGTGELEADSSIKSETMEILYPGEAAQPAGDVALGIYNGVDCNFDIYPPDGSRVRFNKSYLRMEYAGVDITAAPALAALDPVTCSIPWNPIAACIDNCSFSLNAANVEIERYSNHFGHGNMIKLLTQYDRSALESAHDRFFTPCIEERRDHAATISLVSQERAIRAFTWGGGANINYGSKNLMLGDIFDSLRADFAWYVKRSRITVQMKDPSRILFHTSANVAKNRFFITKLELHIFYDMLTPPVIKSEMDRQMQDLSMLKEMYLTYDTEKDVHGADKTYRVNGVTNMVAAVLLFPSNTCTDIAVGGVYYGNPYQYTYGMSATLGDPITSYQHQYNGIYSPRNNLPVAANYNSRNTDLYQQYRLIARMENDTQSTPAVPFHTGMGLFSPTYDLNPYVMFAAPFFDLQTNPVLTPQVADHIIKTTGGGAGNGVVLVRMRVNAVEILSNNAINRLN